MGDAEAESRSGHRLAACRDSPDDDYPDGIVGYARSPSSGSQAIATRAWLVDGFHEAHDRFNVASQNPDAPERLFIPLFDPLLGH